MQKSRIFGGNPALAVPQTAPVGTTVHFVPSDRRKKTVLAPDLVALPAAQYSVPAGAHLYVSTVVPDPKADWIAAVVQDADGLADGLFVGLVDELWLADGLLVELDEPELDDGDELGLELDEQPAMPTAAMMATGTRTTALTLNSNLLHLSIGDHAGSGSPIAGALASRRVVT